MRKATISIIATIACLMSTASIAGGHTNTKENNDLGPNIETMLEPKYHASEAALAAVVESDTVAVDLSKWVVLTPKNKKATTAFVFYPGFGCDPRAYAH